VQGDVDMDPNGQPILTKDPSGKGFVDKKGRKVN